MGFAALQVRFRFPTDMKESAAKKRWKALKAQRLQALHKLGIYWSKFYSLTVLTCTWELFMWPFRLALGPKDEYHAIRAIKQHFTTDDLIVIIGVLLDIIFVSDVILKFISQAALDELDFIERKRKALKQR